MNKTVYMLLKRLFENQKYQKIKNILEKDLSLQEIEQLNIKYNDDYQKVYYNESDIKFFLLNKNKNLFTETEFDYYNNLLSLKIFIKK